VSGCFGGIVVAEFAAENPKDVSSVALMSPGGLRNSHVVNPVLLTPVIGDWVFCVLGADLVAHRVYRIARTARYVGLDDRAVEVSGFCRGNAE
jgi:pimeloyl-ACP methyl ester carboxylesterase